MITFLGMGENLAEGSLETADFDGMYTGCDYDSATGLTYHWNRWRNEDGSAFISEDPARDGANWYGDAGCNPLVYVDRIGLFYYTAEGQQSSTSNTPKTDTNDSSNKTPQNQGQSIPATPDHVAGFSEQRGSYNILPKYKGIETGDKWYNSFVEGIVNYGIIGTYNLCATAINTISNGVGAAYDLINAASETVLGGDLDAITMTMMSNGMLAPAGYILNSFNTYMNGLKLANNTSKVITTALSTVQTSVNLGAGLFNIDPLPTSATKFYVAPNGDCLPSVGIKYIDSGYYDSVKSSMTLNNCSYFGFNNFDSASSAKNALQISTNWGNDCRVRVSFDTMQIFDSTFIPRGFGDTANFLEPYAACYPMLGTGGAQQYRYLGSVKLSDVTLIGE